MNCNAMTKKVCLQSKLMGFDYEKQNNNSDLQSLLVSSIRCDTQALNDVQAKISISKPVIKEAQQSLIKKQYGRNVYVEDRSEKGSMQHSCQCEKKIQNLNETIKLLTLRLQQCESKITLCFNKYSQNSQKISNNQKANEETKYLYWENKQRLKQISSMISKVQQQSKHQLKIMNDDINKIYKQIARWQSKQNQKLSIENRKLQHKIEKYKDDHDHKLNTVVQTIEQLSKLQRKIIQHHPLKDLPNNTYPDDTAPPPQKKYYRAHSISSKPAINQSTNISFSQNYDLPR